MQAKVETELSRRLENHRAEHVHPLCDICHTRACCRHCRVYFDISRRATQAKTIQEGRLNIAHSWLSVREPQDF
jgi:hypothetical protein